MSAEKKLIESLCDCSAVLLPQCLLPFVVGASVERVHTHVRMHVTSTLLNTVVYPGGISSAAGNLLPLAILLFLVDTYGGFTCCTCHVQHTIVPRRHRRLRLFRHLFVFASVMLLCC